MQLFATKVLIDKHLSDDDKEIVFSRWNTAVTNSKIGTEHAELGKAVRNIRASSNSARFLLIFTVLRQFYDCFTTVLRLFCD